MLVFATLVVLASAPRSQVDVPLVAYSSPNYPNGFSTWWSLGLSFGDYDGDGWVDLYANLSGYLWHNEQGQDWRLDKVLQPGAAVFRYGASFGDYNRDGLPDLITEPRQGNCVKLLQNLGRGAFRNLGADPEVIIAPCTVASETACWGDVDFDGWIDVFLPTYPTPQGNYFWRNLGPVGSTGEHRFVEMSVAAGLGVPPANNRPEGAQMCDYDFDGDLDIYSNGALYRNESTPGQPLFVALSEEGSGIGLSAFLDEGALWVDYDLDGDLDVLVSYTLEGNIIWENRGDGTYFQAEPGIVEEHYQGVDFGSSAVDWDNDGDIDWTTRHVFRRNMLAETGQRRMALATHEVVLLHLVRPVVAWADFDRDGDLDAAIGNFWPEFDGEGHFYENTTYDASTPASARRYLRVRPLRDESEGPGTETEFGATAELRVAGERGVRRLGFTASGHGYLNQNEYALHLALPSPPTGPTVLSAQVDFVHDPSVSYWRVDRHVNPVLGGLVLEALADREIDVYRSGRAVVDGCDVRPTPSESPQLWTSAKGLVAADPAAGLPPLVEAGENVFVGIEIATLAEPVRVVELVLDGQLAAGGPHNLAVWDVTDPENPVLVDARVEETSPRNDRSALPYELLLQPEHTYRVVAHVDALRGSPVAGPIAEPHLTIAGGLTYVDADPTTGEAVRTAEVDATQVYLALRYRPALLGTPIDLGNGMQPTTGHSAVLSAAGPVELGRPFQLEVRGLPASAPLYLIAGTSVSCLRVQGQAILVPGSAVAVPGAFTSTASGKLSLPIVLPRGLPAGLGIAFQVWYADPASTADFASTNLLVVPTPF